MRLQLAQLVDDPPEGSEWLHEVKYDGYRILAEKDGSKVRLLSRREKDWTAEFPTIARAIAALPAKRAILDGEVAVLLPDGRTSFQGLQSSFSAPNPNLVYFAFDLLAEGDESLASLPLEERKARLEKLVKKSTRIRYSDHVVGHGRAFFEAACKAGLEGIVSKRRDRSYQPGRGRAWQKTKCIKRQEFVIGGFTDRESVRGGLGALLVGYYDGGRFKYAGKVGTGYTHAMLDELYAMLVLDEQRVSPFVEGPPNAAHRHWVTPKHVCEVAFGEWTDDGRLRHPSFRGLRKDKRPRDVVRE